MKLNLASLAALVLCTSLTFHATANDEAGAAAVAEKFVDALKHQQFKDAASLFAPETKHDTSETELSLKRIDHTVGGFSRIRPVATLPNGKTVKLEVPSHKDVTYKVQKSIQFRYTATANDGQAVFYALDLTTDSKRPQVLTFEVHFPAADARSGKRATELVSLIGR